MLPQALRFVVTGGVNTAFGYGIYAACIYLGTGYAIASGASIVCGVLFSYKTTSAMVFGRGYRGSLARYLGSYVIVYAASVLMLKTMDAYGSKRSAARARERNVLSTPKSTSARGRSAVRMAWLTIDPASPEGRSSRSTPCAASKASMTRSGR